MSLLGGPEPNLQVFVGDDIPNSWVMFNWAISQPLSEPWHVTVFLRQKSPVSQEERSRYEALALISEQDDPEMALDLLRGSGQSINY